MSTAQENRIPVSYEGEWIYDILFESSYDGISEEMSRLGYQNDTKVCIVTDSNVAELYGKHFCSSLSSDYPNTKLFVFDAGEESKNLDTIQKLYEFLIINHFERRDLLIALGGGVVGDMTGFAAATYLRGIDFIQIPTTLLSQVDSSIGGKTGVDFAQYKNMVGAFNQPALVYMNLNVLKTLPEEQFASGMAEALKSGLIRDKKYFSYLEENRSRIQAVFADEIQHTVAGSCKIKREVVQKDPKEKGERALLNFGHTIGHAIEKLSDFRLFHGECVALGMVAASYISWKIGNITVEDLNRIEKSIAAYRLPTRLSAKENENKDGSNTQAVMNPQEILNATKSDKKMENGHVKFVLLKELGDAYVSREISDEILLDGIAHLFS